MNLLAHLRQRLAGLILPFPAGFSDAHTRAQYSLLFPDDHGPPSDRLIDLALQAIQHARSEDLSSIAARMTSTPRWPEIWPGEHYKLLAGIVKALVPKTVIEIGTFQGLSALALAKNLPAGGSVHTFDVIPYGEIAGQTLRPSDFEGGRIIPVVADLAGERVFDQHRDLFERAELIFIDAAKDGRMERVFLERLESVRFRRPPIGVFDDIRQWTMLAIWRAVQRPKLDLTSFGHWSGTGLIDWQPAEK